MPGNGVLMKLKIRRTGIFWVADGTIPHILLMIVIRSLLWIGVWATVSGASKNCRGIVPWLLSTNPSSGHLGTITRRSPLMIKRLIFFLRNSPMTRAHYRLRLNPLFKANSGLQKKYSLMPHTIMKEWKFIFSFQKMVRSLFKPFFFSRDRMIFTQINLIWM